MSNNIPSISIKKENTQLIIYECDVKTKIFNNELEEHYKQSCGNNYKNGNIQNMKLQNITFYE